MFRTSLSKSFWEKYVQTGVYLIKSTPNKLLHGKSPYEVFFHNPLDYSSLCVFGCLCHAHVQTRENFDSWSRECIFVGYPFGKKCGNYLTCILGNFLFLEMFFFSRNRFSFSQFSSPRPLSPPPLGSQPDFTNPTMHASPLHDSSPSSLTSNMHDSHSSTTSSSSPHSLIELCSTSHHRYAPPK